jgi:magnesium transporter
MESKLEITVEAMKILFAEKKFFDLKRLLTHALAADIVEIIKSLEISEQVILFRLLSKETASEVFSLLAHEEQEVLLEHFGMDRVKEIIEGMEPDDRTELFDELPDKMVRRLMWLLSPEDRKTVNRLLNYPDDSAGRLMTPEFVKIGEHMTAEESLNKIRRIGINKETIYYSYVVDDRDTLLGIVSLRQILLADPDQRIGDFMKTNIVSSSTHDDQEEAARLLTKYDLSAIPVTDSEHKLVGIITVDDVVDVIHEEATEDFLKMAGIEAPEDPYFNTSFLQLGRKRALWLVVLLVTSYLSSVVLKNYSDILQIIVPLAFFIPMLTGTCGNTGMQSATLIIRGLATGEILLGDALKVTGREILMGLFLGVILGAFAFVRALFLDVDPFVGIIVGLSVLISVIVSNIIGSMLPLVLKKLKIDPAISAGPFISTIIDVTSLILYFEIAKVVLRLPR